MMVAENSKIQWCDDSISFWWGCTKIAPGCAHCYALDISMRFGGDIWGPTKPRMRIDSAAANLLRLNKKAERKGRPRVVFVNSMSDFFEEHQGPVVDGQKQVIDGCSLDMMRSEAFALFDQCQWLTLLLLTKRPENIRRMWSLKSGIDGLEDMYVPRKSFRQNCWIGCSVSDQATADAAIPELLKCRDLAPVLFVSYEPALGPANLIRWLTPWHGMHSRHNGIDWVILGGESGRNARPCRLEWIRSAVKQCHDAEVACFVKQLGANVYGCEGDEEKPRMENGRRYNADPKGGDPSEWPPDLQVRQFPEIKEPVHGS